MRSFLRELLALYICVLACNANAGGFIDYKPSVFSEQAAQPFFFSIGKKLKYGNAIREDAPTLFEAGLFDSDINIVFPSPDQKKAVVMLGDRLYLAQPGKPPIKLLQPFELMNFNGLQWDPKSRYIFIPRYIYPNNKRQFIAGLNSALLRIDTNEPIAEQELIPSSQFRMLTEFFPLNDDSVCFNSSTHEGNVIWKCWISGNIHSVKRLGLDQITFADGTTIKEKPFLSYPMRGGEISLALGGYSLNLIPNNLQVEFFHRNKPNLPIFRVQGVIEPLKGHFGDGLRDGESSILPGDRYAFLTIWDRKLVVDSETGLYKEVPKDSRVYLNFNSHSNQAFFRINDILDHEGHWFGIEFARTPRLRTNYNP